MTASDHIIPLIQTWREDGDGAKRTETLLVRWESVEACKGKRIRLDNMNRVKYNIAHLTPEETFENLVVLVAAAPVEMVFSKYLREPVPDWLIDLMRHADAQHDAGPLQ